MIAILCFSVALIFGAALPAYVMGYVGEPQFGREERAGMFEAGWVVLTVALFVMALCGANANACYAALGAAVGMFAWYFGCEVNTSGAAKRTRSNINYRDRTN